MAKAVQIFGAVGKTQWREAYTNDQFCWYGFIIMDQNGAWIISSLC